MAETPVAGSVLSSASDRVIALPLTLFVPPVAYWMPYRRPWMYSAPYAASRPVRE